MKKKTIRIILYPRSPNTQKKNEGELFPCNCVGFSVSIFSEGGIFGFSIEVQQNYTKKFFILS